MGYAEWNATRSPAQAKLASSARPAGPSLALAFAGEDRTGTIAEQSLEPLSIADLDAGCGVEREPCPELVEGPPPCPHSRLYGCGLGREQAPPLEQAQ